MSISADKDYMYVDKLTDLYWKYVDKTWQPD